MSEKNPLSLFSSKRILLPLLIGIGVAVLLILKDIKNDSSAITDILINYKKVVCRIAI